MKQQICEPLMENSIRLIKQVEHTHKGLGIPILFGNLCILARTSIIYIGEKGIGKGTSIKAIRGINIDEGFDMSFDTVTLSQLASRLSQCLNRNIMWRMEEWSTLSRYHRELFLTVGAKIITDKQFYHEMGEHKGQKIIIDIKNTDLSCLIGITPLKMSRLMVENENWESLASDRFLKFIMVNPLRKDSTRPAPKYDLSDTISNPILPINTSFTLAKVMFNKQLSDDRLILTIRELMNAYANFEGYKDINNKVESEFVKLFGTYLRIYPSLIYSRDIEEETHLAVGALRALTMIIRHNGITKEKLMQEFSVYEKQMLDINRPYKLQNASEMIARHTGILVNKGMITIEQNSPVRYYMSDRFQKFFDWYGGL